MIPCIITSFVGTLAALFMVASGKRINLFNLPVMLGVLGVSVVIGGLMAYISGLPGVAKFHFTDNLSNGMLLTIIGLIVGLCLPGWRSTSRQRAPTCSRASCTAQGRLHHRLRVLPYMLAMLAALSIFRNSGLDGSS
jgi:hypothetical protein